MVLGTGFKTSCMLGKPFTSEQYPQFLSVVLICICLMSNSVRDTLFFGVNRCKFIIQHVYREVY